MAHSEFWMGKDWLARMPHAPSPGYYSMLGKLRRSVADFVRAVTGQNIPVSFSTENQSYSDGKSVVISGAHTPAEVDITVGLALHEAAHVLLSAPLFECYQAMAAGTLLTKPYIQPSYKALNLPDHKLLHMLLNVLEDRRIDSWMYARIGGWRPYYEALYAKYFHTDAVRDDILNPLSRTETLANYEFHIINMPSRHFDVNALKLLPEVMRLVDLPNVRRFDDFPTMAKTAQAIIVLLYNAASVDKSVTSPRSDQSGQPGDGEISDPIPGHGPSQNSDARERKQLVMGRPAHTQESQLTEAEADRVDAAEKMKITTSQHIMSEGGQTRKHRVTILENIQNVSSDVFAYGNDQAEYENYILMGLSRGNVLARKLRIMGEDFPLKMNRQLEGRLDRRRVAALGHEDMTVFSRQHIVKADPVHVHLSIDASGSMIGPGFGNAMAFAAMLARAAECTPMMTLEVSLRSYVNSEVLIAVIYDSVMDTTAKFRKLLTMVGPSGCTPEGLAFNAIFDRLVARKPGVQHYFVNLSDGFPGCAGYDGQYALQHTGQVVKRLVRSGVRVLSYLIGSHNPNEQIRNQFAVMYGSNAAYVSPEDVTGIARTLNKMFVVKH